MISLRVQAVVQMKDAYSQYSILKIKEKNMLYRATSPSGSDNDDLNPSD